MSAVRVSNVAPIIFYRCPQHDYLVAADGEGGLLGRCAGCSAETARAHQVLRKMPKRKLTVAP